MLMHDYEKESKSISDEEVEKWLKENPQLKTQNEFVISLEKTSVQMIVKYMLKILFVNALFHFWNG